MKEFIFNETNAFCINLKESQNRWIKMENKFIKDKIKKIDIKPISIVIKAE